MTPGPLSAHGITLVGARVVLRPMTEEDWNVLLRWHQDPEVLYYAEGDDVLSHTVEEVRQSYRSVAQSALLFIIEQDGEPVGECWLQRMNLERVLGRYPGRDLRRIDLMIGEKQESEGGRHSPSVSCSRPASQRRTAAPMRANS